MHTRRQGSTRKVPFLGCFNPAPLFQFVSIGDLEVIDAARLFVSDDDLEILNDESDERNRLVIYLATRKVDSFAVVLIATLHFFTRDLGLLLLQDDLYFEGTEVEVDAQFITAVKSCYGLNMAWAVIEYCFRHAKNRRYLFLLDKERSIFPFMLATMRPSEVYNDGDIKLTLLYYLMREDLSWLQSAL